MRRANRTSPHKPVRVTRNGNARTLTVPAEIAAEAGIEVGDMFMVEAVDGDLLYRRLDDDRPRGHFVGEGTNRVYVLPSRASMPVGQDPIERVPLEDWDF